MMLWSEAHGRGSGHDPYSALSGAGSPDHRLILRTGRIVDRDLRERFGIAAPRLAVAGLNPHAGENGTIGLEDREIVAPAVAALRAEGIAAEGPLPADTMFHARARQSYDAALVHVSRPGADPDQDASPSTRA